MSLVLTVQELFQRLPGSELASSARGNRLFSSAVTARHVKKPSTCSTACLAEIGLQLAFMIMTLGALLHGWCPGCMCHCWQLREGKEERNDSMVVGEQRLLVARKSTSGRMAIPFVVPFFPLSFPLLN